MTLTEHTHRWQFLKIEYTALREEIRDLKGRIFRLIGFVLVSVPSASALADRMNIPVLKMALPVFVVAMALLYYNLSTSLMRCGRYIRYHIEDEMRRACDHADLGWEHWLQEAKTEGEPGRRMPDILEYWFFSIVLVIYFLSGAYVGWGELDGLLTARLADLVRIGYGVVFVALVATMVYFFSRCVYAGRIAKVLEAPGVSGKPGTVLALDIGGSSARYLISPPEQYTANHELDVENPAPFPVRTRLALTTWLSESLPSPVNERIHTVVAAVAAPLQERTLARIVNWPTGDNKLTVEDLAVNGLGTDRVHLLNDLEAAAWGLDDLRGRVPDSTEWRTQLKAGTCEIGSHEAATCLVIAPGQGLGSAAVRWGPGKPGLREVDVVPSEMQHAPAALDTVVTAEVGKALHAIVANPSWEDVVSGPGLERLFRAVRHSQERDVPAWFADSPDPAAAVAARAAAGRSASAGDALLLYYRILIRFVQALSLAHRPLGGTYIAGRTTRANEGFVLRHRDVLVRDFASGSSAVRTVLDPIAIYLVRTELNLRGAVRYAARKLTA